MLTLIVVILSFGGAKNKINGEFESPSVKRVPSYDDICTILGTSVRCGDKCMYLGSDCYCGAGIIKPADNEKLCCIKSDESCTESEPENVVFHPHYSGKIKMAWLRKELMKG